MLFGSENSDTILRRGVSQKFRRSRLRKNIRPLLPSERQLLSNAEYNSLRAAARDQYGRENMAKSVSEDLGITALN